MHSLFDEYYSSKALIKHFIQNVIDDLITDYDFENNRDILILILIALRVHGFNEIQCIK